MTAKLLEKYYNNFDQKYGTEISKLICAHTYKQNTKYLTGITNIATS